MREASLPSPEVGAKGYHLRRISATVISQMQTSARNYPSGYHPDAPALKAFFDACSAAVADMDAP